MPFRSRISLASALTTTSSMNPVSSSKHAQAETIELEPSTTPLPPDDGLPAPVQASNYPSPSRKQKRTRINLGFHIHWDRFLRKLGSGTAPSTSSALDESSGDSTTVYHRSQQGRNGGGGGVGGGGGPEDTDAEVDEVVVDREWSSEIKSSVHSEHGGSPEKSGGSNPQIGFGGTNTDRDSFAVHDGFWTSCTFLVFLRYRICPVVLAFFSTHFMDDKSEQHYKKENWFLRKVSYTYVNAVYPSQVQSKSFLRRFLPVVLRSAIFSRCSALRRLQ